MNLFDTYFIVSNLNVCLLKNYPLAGVQIFHEKYHLPTKGQEHFDIKIQFWFFHIQYPNFLVCNLELPDISLENMAVFVGSINSPKIRSTRLSIHKWFAYSEHILAIDERPTKFLTMNICFLDSSSLITKEEIMLRTPIKILR